MSRTALLTADDLMHISLPDKRTELVRGVLVVHEPPGFIHGYVVHRLVLAIGNYVDANQLGMVVTADAGFKLFSNPDTVRGPDLAFISHARMPTPPPAGYASFAPDLAVEVRSPGDRAGELREKVADWLGGGSKLVWIIDPTRRSADVHRANATTSHIGSDGTLDGEDVLPGFLHPLAKIFA
jgi:Uma2 family endonuclease